MKERVKYSTNSLLGSGLISSRVSFLGIMPAAGLMPISAVVLVALNSLQGNIKRHDTLSTNIFFKAK